MGHTFVHLAYHVVFSTKGRIACINNELSPQLHAYIAGIARGLGGKTLIVNGVADHVHLLVQLPATISVAEFVRDIKANSSKWMHEEMGIPRSKFSWQTGYGCFSVSKSNLSNAQKYIAKQEEHHRKISFQEEFLLFLKQHEIAYDEKYIWE
jgi:putative transposase